MFTKINITSKDNEQDHVDWLRNVCEKSATSLRM